MWFPLYTPITWEYETREMYLKNLTTLGFKSFADKTSLNFEPGITAIVGPNGCGKSNIADAIRWVLGEQSAKALRGGEMADVIFNGTDSRGPLGFAEVSLTIGGIDQEQLKAAGVELAYDEVTLTRRVFRDGGSEYYLNKTACRLKDIQQLFAGTGVGRASYSIMAQGNITQILSSKPDDRRLVFEEAAGITRFKAQKREALRKLEQTEQNLLRVSDLIREVKRQIISLQRQAGKARRYKTLMAELQHLDTQLARHQYDTLLGEIQERQTRLEELRHELERGTQELLGTESDVSELRAMLAGVDQEVAAAQQRSLELKGECDRHLGRVQYNEERLREFAGQYAAAFEAIAQADERRLASEQELAAVSERLTTAAARLAELRTGLEARRQAVQAIELELREQQAAQQRLQTEQFGEAQRLARTRNDLAALELQKQGDLVRLDKLSAEKLQLEEERRQLQQRLVEFEQNSEAQQRDVQARRLGVEERQQRLRALQAELNEVTRQLEICQREQAELSSRRGVLAQLEASHEGFGAGALAALKSAHGVLGSLADRIRVAAAEVPAVEAALGHHLQLVLTEQPESAQQILAELAAGKQGRASVAPLALRNGFMARSEIEQQLTERLATWQCRPALSVVEAEPSVLPLLHGLLGRTQIVPDLATATAAWRETHGEFDFVTLGGEVLSRYGVFTGGQTNGNGGVATSILARKNEISRLEQQLAGLQERIAGLSRQKGALLSEQTALQAGLQEAQTELRAQEVALATRQGEFKALQQALTVLGQKVDTVVFEIQNLAERQQEAESRRHTLAAELAEREKAEAALQERGAAFQAALEGGRQRRDAAGAELTESKVALAAEEQVHASLRQQQRPLEQRIEELRQAASQRRREVDGLLQRRGQAEAEIAESRLRAEALEQEREAVNRRLAELGMQRAAQDAEIHSREETLRELRRRQNEVQEERGALEVALAERRVSLQNLRERLQQKYQVQLDEIRSECIRITFAADGPAKVVVVTPEEMANAGVATDWAAVAEQVAALQRRLDEMGPVNLVAIEEFEEAEQRHQHLATQHDDLVEAKRQLVDILNRVNAETQVMFTETFARVRENFCTLFVEIFGGGTADLELVDAGDVLESGIEIMARPPGKQLRSISLLSGGEQTMTAVALLFAIYMVRPSPFCVLDELDAPLDESNINRFVRILQRFLAHSQFVIITHNKRTIAMADVLYGITMQEHGVSKIVSVKFHKSREPATPETPHSLETPTNVPPLEPEEDRILDKQETLELARN
ncbi:MAG: chromosome segregation protein SMC [Verrucomicrobia bacterium]|nr:chromosome segregation protein SMC [Verrucomicrobiota bacterium]